MHRREFLQGVAGGTVSLGLFPVRGLQPAEGLPRRTIPRDKGITTATLEQWKARGRRRVYRGERLFALGMPVGGICAGQVYLLGDGSLGEWHVDGRLNATGYGATSYRTRAPSRQLDQGFTLTLTRLGDEALAGAEIRLGSGGDRTIEFVGEYPVALVRYLARPSEERRPQDGMDVTLRAYSPFCPINARESALPCTVLRYTIRNTWDRPVTCDLSGWLENGVEPAEPGDVRPARRTREVRESGLTALLMDAVEPVQRADPRPERLLADFEGETYVGWNVEGEAFGAGPSRGTEPDQNTVSGFAGRGLVNSFRGGSGTPAGDRPTGKLTSNSFTIDRDFLTFLIGGGAHRTQTCMNLLVDGKVVRTAAGASSEKLEPRAWDVRDLAGREARLEIVDAATGPWGHINVDHIVLADRLPEALRRPRPDSLTSGTMCLAFLGDARAETPVGAPGLLHAPLTLDPGESRELVFVVAWHFPNLHTGHGQMYANWFEDALAVARHVRDHDTRLLAQTDLFRRTYYDDTTLPWWLALRLMMPTANLATGTAQWWRNGRFWGWEGVGCCHGTCTHVWNYSHAEARLFPELARTTRVMQDLGTAFDERTGRVAFRGDVTGGFDYAADGQAGTVLKCFREHLCSPDDLFLRDHWPRIRLALQFLIDKDAELGGSPDGVIEGIQHNTYDIDFVGANTMVGSLYLAALRAGAKMAVLAGDDAFAATCLDLAARGRAWTEARLFNGEYFIQQPPPGARRWQYDTGCLSDQLFGQSWARALDLGTLYDPALVQSALRAIYLHNFAPPGGSLEQHNTRFPPEREFARDREGGLFVCTWPRGGRPGEPVRYRDEVWTGIEYQVAAGMVWEGLVDEALALVRAVDERYDGALHNPWNEVECGDHYARAMAAWGVFQALCGFHYDGPAGVIGMEPRLTPDRFAAFFAAAQGWGLLAQDRSPGAQQNRFELRWGSLTLRRVRARLPADATGARASLTRAGATASSLLCTVERAEGMVTAALSAPVTLGPGDTLALSWTY